MSTRPEAGSPDELIWLRGFEEARNYFLKENTRLRNALEFYADTKEKYDCFTRFDEDFVYIDESDIEKIPFKHGDQYGFIPYYGKKARAALEGK